MRCCITGSERQTGSANGENILRERRRLRRDFSSVRQAGACAKTGESKRGKCGEAGTRPAVERAPALAPAQAKPHDQWSSSRSSRKSFRIHATPDHQGNTTTTCTLSVPCKAAGVVSHAFDNRDIVWPCWRYRSVRRGHPAAGVAFLPTRSLLGRRPFRDTASASRSHTSKPTPCCRISCWKRVRAPREDHYQFPQ